jgi:hypothetical protein
MGGCRGGGEGGGASFPFLLQTALSQH